jgi:hypothetical protein
LLWSNDYFLQGSGVGHTDYFSFTNMIDNDNGSDAEVDFPGNMDVLLICLFALVFDLYIFIYLQDMSNQSYGHVRSTSAASPCVVVFLVN